jgi:hypothetical protein
MYHLFFILTFIIGLATTTITVISNNITLVAAKDYNEYSKMYETKIEYCEQIQYVGYISKDLSCSNLILLGDPTERVQMDKLIAEWIIMVEPVNERIKILKDLELPLPENILK